MVIKRVGPVSRAKITGTLYAILGIFFGGIFSLIALAGGFASEDSGAFPILYGLLGFVATLIGAWLYNLVAGLVGGIEMEIQ